jgi:carboxypeptidase T
MSGDGFYPPDELIPSEIQRNYRAAIFVAQIADCPPRVVPRNSGSNPCP